VSVISTPFPWSPLKLHSNYTLWSGNGVEIKGISGVGVELKSVEWSWSGNGVRNFELFRD
jgi:hypothetical protein